MKVVYKLLPFILIFTFVFSIPISASDDSPWPISASTSNYPFDSFVYDDVSKWHNYIQSNKGWHVGIDISDMEVFVLHSVGTDYVSYIYTPAECDFYVGERTDSYCNLYQKSVNGYGIAIVQIFISDGSVRDCFGYTGAIYVDVNDDIFYVNERIYGSNGEDTGLLFFTSEAIEDVPSDSPYLPGNDFGALDAMFEGLDAGVQAETLTDTDSTSNSNVFLRIFQSMTGIQSNTGKLVNSIAFHISEIRSNLDSYMNDIVQNGFNGVKGLLEDILAAIKDIAVAALPENLVTMIDQLYESGLDADGNFGVDTMLGYWFVPDPDTMHDMLSEAINSSSEFAEILDFAEWFKQHLVNLEPVAPMFTIQPGEYGFITIKNEIRISFEWFEVWKPYTDPLIAAFLYITYFWHLFMSIPGILNGTAATTYAATHMQEPNVPLVSNWQNGVFRK